MSGLIRRKADLLATLRSQDIKDSRETIPILLLYTIAVSFTITHAVAMLVLWNRSNYCFCFSQLSAISPLPRFQHTHISAALTEITVQL